MNESPPPSAVSVSELRSGVEMILDAVEAQHGATIELGADSYWTLDSASSFDLTQEPALNTGPLGDDVEALRNIGTAEPRAVWHELDHLLGLLRRVSALARP